MSAIYAAQLEARQAAAETLHEMWGDVYPVDPYRIAADLGITVYRGDLPGNVSGMLRRAEDGTVEMYIDTDDSERRQRFTAAHELGHFVQRLSRGELETKELAFIDRRGQLATEGSNPGEVYANEFAACLLMPELVVRRLRRNGMHGYQLAEFFDVSMTSMEYRLKNLRAK